MPGIGIGNAIPFKRGGINWSSYWTQQPEVLFFGLYSEISGGQMPNKKAGATDFLTVAGSAGSETYQCPNTAAYIAADTDYIWFKTNAAQRTVTTAELIGYDLQRTPVKYDDTAPNAIVAIIILNAAVTGTKLNNLFRDMWLSIFWDNSLNVYGHIKSNRLAQTLWTPESVVSVYVNDSNSNGWFDGDDLDTITKDGSNLVSIWWDKRYGNDTLGAEQASGNLVVYAVYIITATQDNFFYTGCAVGETFICSVVKTCDANNKVRRYTGNHLTQPAATSQPLWSTSGILFDGIDNFLHAATFTWVRPEFIYMVVKQKTWTVNDYIFDGQGTNSGAVYCRTSTPNLTAFASGGSLQNNGNLALDTWGILRVYFQAGAAPDAHSFQINNTAAVVGNWGTGLMSGFTLGCRGALDAGYGNIEVAEIVLRKTADDAAVQTDIYNYLATKYGLPTI